MEVSICLVERVRVRVPRRAAVERKSDQKQNINWRR